MINKPMLNIVYAIALFSPVVSVAACLNSNDSAENMTTGDCHYKAEYYIAGLEEPVVNQPANDQKTVDQSAFSAFEGSGASNVSSKGGFKKRPNSSETNLDNFEWTPADWHEVY